MKCPHCQQDLRRSTKDPQYGLCDFCRKKYPWHDTEDDDYEEEDSQDRYNLDDLDDSDDSEDLPITVQESEPESFFQDSKPTTPARRQRPRNNHDQAPRREQAQRSRPRPRPQRQEPVREVVREVYREPEYDERPSRKRGMGGLSIFFIIVAVLIVVGGVFIYIQSRDNGNLEETIKDDINKVEGVIKDEVDKGVDEVEDVVKDVEEKVEEKIDDTKQDVENDLTNQ